MTFINAHKKILQKWQKQMIEKWRNRCMDDVECRCYLNFQIMILTDVNVAESEKRRIDFKFSFVSPLQLTHKQFHLQLQYKEHLKLMLSLTPHIPKLTQTGSQPSDISFSNERLTRRVKRSTCVDLERKKRKVQTLVRIKKETQGYQSSLWQLTENTAYMRFLIENQDLFYTSRFQRKAIKINVLMADFIVTRSPDQCRSHHQKMIKYHQDIPNIILHIQNLIRDASQKQGPQEQSEEEKTLPHQSPILSAQPSMPSYQPQLTFPDYELESWVEKNAVLAQERVVEDWLQGVQDKYGNL